MCVCVCVCICIYVYMYIYIYIYIVYLYHNHTVYNNEIKPYSTPLFLVLNRLVQRHKSL